MDDMYGLTSFRMSPIQWLTTTFGKSFLRRSIVFASMIPEFWTWSQIQSGAKVAAAL